MEVYIRRPLSAFDLPHQEPIIKTSSSLKVAEESVHNTRLMDKLLPAARQ